MEKMIVVLFGFFGMLALIFGMSLLMAYPTLWLVNYLFTPTVITALFGVVKLGVWKAWALNMTAGMLFKNSKYSSK